MQQCIAAYSRLAMLARWLYLVDRRSTLQDGICRADLPIGYVTVCLHLVDRRSTLQEGICRADLPIGYAIVCLHLVDRRSTLQDGICRADLLIGYATISHSHFAQPAAVGF